MSLDAEVLPRHGRPGSSSTRWRVGPRRRRRVSQRQVPNLGAVGLRAELLATSGARPRRPNNASWPNSSARGHLTPSHQTRRGPTQRRGLDPLGRAEAPSSSSLHSETAGLHLFLFSPAPPANPNPQNRPPVPRSRLPKVPRGNGPSPPPFYPRRCAYIVLNHLESRLFGYLVYLCLHLQNVWLRMIECIVV